MLENPLTGEPPVGLEVSTLAGLDPTIPRGAHLFSAANWDKSVMLHMSRRRFGASWNRRSPISSSLSRMTAQRIARGRL